MITDISLLREFTGDDREKIAKYIKLYLDNASKEVEELKKGLETTDWELVRRAAHTLKPQLRYMGMLLTNEKAQQIETIIDDKLDLAQLPSIIKLVESDCEKSFRELKEYLKSNS